MRTLTIMQTAPAILPGESRGEFVQRAMTLGGYEPDEVHEGESIQDVLEGAYDYKFHEYFESLEEEEQS